jgi:hypothetical protein
MALFSAKSWLLASSTGGLYSLYELGNHFAPEATGKVLGIIQAFFSHYLNPVKLMAWGMTLVGGLLEAIGHLMPGEAGEQFKTFGTFFDSVPFTRTMGIIGWMMSPVLPVSLVVSCISIIITVWFASLILKSVMFVKNHIWSSGA